MASQKKGGKKSRTTKNTRQTAKRQVSRSESIENRENDVPEGLYLEISILFLLALCIILILGNFGLTLRFGDVFNSLFFGVFGGMEYVFPFFLFIGVCFYLINKKNLKAIIKLISAVILFFDIGMFLQLYVSDDYNLGGYSGTYDYSASNRSGGGIISGSIFEALQKNLGRPATIIIMIIILLTCIMVISGNSIIKLISYQGMELADRAKESRIEREKDLEVIREEKKLIREEERERRSQKRAVEREEKRKKIRENSKQKKRDFLSLSVGDDNKNGDSSERLSPETEAEEYLNSFRQNEIFEEDRKKEESHVYSPFSMTPEHMIKPKDYDRKPLPKEIPEVRLNDPVAPPVKEEAIPSYDNFEDEHFEESGEKSISYAHYETPQEKSEKNSGEDAFYDELVRLHEIEGNDMHEITFDDYDTPDTVSFADEIKLHKSVPEEEIHPDIHDEGPYHADHFEEEITEEEPFEEDIIEEKPFEEPAEDQPFEEDPFEDEPFIEVKKAPRKEVTKKEEPKKKEEPPKKDIPDKPYELPPLSLLKTGKSVERESESSLRDTAEKLKNILSSFGVKVRMLNFIQGPTVTRFEMQPEQGVKVSTILNLSNDIQMNLAAKDIRIEAPIPGKAAVGIEIPNKTNSPVYLRELLESEAFNRSKSKITFAVGKDIGGEAIVYDIGKMPHLLIAGATGSGKSVCINTIIMSILYKAKPDEVKLIMIDPKVVELSVYNGIPHLLTPVVTDPVKAAGALNWGVAEMMKRYQLFARVHVRNMEGYNDKVPELLKAGETLPDGSPYETLPQIVIIVDELADLMMVQKKDVEASICRLAQLARAAGIHLIIATQRPSVDVITGLIKANMPSRVAFAVSSNVDSRTILDSAGAEKLLGNGDMLFYPQKYPKPERLQGAFVSDDEVQDVTDFIRNEAASLKDDSKDISEEINAAAANTSSGSDTNDNPTDASEYDDGRDAYFADAGRFVTEKKKATIGVLQRMFRIGFNRAARIMDQLAEAGVVSGEDGTKPRQVLMSKEEFEDYLNIGVDTEGFDETEDNEDED